jgi:flagellar motor switch protein FliG
MPSRLTGAQKAAILLLSLGEEAAAEVIKNFTEEEIRDVTRYMTRFQEITAEDVARVTAEFYLIAERTRQLPAAPETKTQYLKKILARALGEEKSQAIVEGLVSSQAAGALERLRWHDPATIAEFVSGEHPQVIAVILANLGDAGLTQAVVSELPERLQSDVIARLARLRTIPDEMLKEIEESLGEQMAARGTPAGKGAQQVAGVLSSAPRRLEQTLMGQLRRGSPGIADQVREHMFPFEDFLKVDNPGVQKVIARTSGEDLVLALKLADESLRHHFLRNMSEQSARDIQAALDALGPTPVATIEAAQKRICAVGRQLAEQGALTVLARRKSRPEPEPA